MNRTAPFSTTSHGRTALVAAAICAAFAASSLLAVDVPDSYIDYVESTGSQYVDTGIEGRYGTKVEVRFTGWTDNGSSLFGAVGNASYNNNHFLPYRSGNNIRFIFGPSGGSGDKTTSAGANAIDIYHKTVAEVTDDGTVKMTYDNNAAVTSSSGSGQLTTGTNIWLFAGNSRGSAGWPCKARLFGCRIWQDGDLVRDYRPCMKDGRPGLYEAIEQKIVFSNSGTDLVAPSDFPIFIEYAESSGSQYVDTGVEGRYGTTVEAKFTGMTVSGRALFGSVGSNNMHFLGMRNGNNLRFIYGASGGSGDKNTALTYGADVYHEEKCEVTDSGAINVSIDGQLKTQVAAIGQNSTGLNMYIFAGNSRGAPGWQASAKLHRCTIWQDGNLVRDFVPCRKNSLVGLYDVVESLFYPSLGALTAGPDLKPAKFVHYVASSGSPYVDTGVVGRYGTTVEMKFTDMTVRNTAMFGAVGSGKHFLGMCNNGGNGLRFIYNTSGRTGDTNTSLVFGAGAGHDIKCEVTAEGAINVSADGDLKTHVNALGRFSSGLSMYIFAGNNGGSPSWSATVKVHGCRIWQDGVLVRDFRPCVDQGGRAALFDVVEVRYHYPQGNLVVSETEVPATAYWKGGAVTSAADLSNPANWDCFRPDGAATSAGLVPTAQTTVVITNAADALLSIPSGIAVPEWGDVKFAASVTLSAAADWSGLGRLTFGKGVTIDLNGNALTVAQFVAEGVGTATIANSGASVAALTVTGAGMTSLERITLGNKVKLLKSGSGLLGVASEYRIGSDSRNAEVGITDGTFWMEGNMRLGWNAPGTLTIGEGAKVRANDGSVGHNSGGVGTLNMTGGEFCSEKDLWFGAFGTSVGTFNQSGGTAVIGVALRLAGANVSSTSARGSFVQTGGTLEVGEILKGSGIAEVTLNGGTLKPRKANNAFFHDLNNVMLGAGGVTIDSDYNIGATGTTITVQSGGKIVKTGTGTFDLSGITVRIDASVKSGFDFAVAAEGTGVGGFSGLPAVPGNWTARLSPDGKTCRIIPKGFMMIVR